MNNDKLSRYVLNPGFIVDDSIEEQYMWSTNPSDDVVPGLESILEYLELNYTTITSLQNAITDVSNHVQTEIDNIEIPTNPSVSKITRHHYVNYEHNTIKNILINTHIIKVITITFTMTLLILREHIIM